MLNPFLKQIENRTGVDMQEILALANAIQYADFSNEKQVRKIIKKVSKIANKPVSKELEDQIVSSIVNDGESLDLGKIQKMLG